MVFPNQAFKRSQLKIESSFGGASHRMYRVTAELNGAKISGFFKEADPEEGYPGLLCKISCAISVFKEFFQENKTAREFLILDDEGKEVIGTFSEAIDGFQSFNYDGEVAPANAAERELVIPSTKTLIEKRMIETLFVRYLFGDDDSHPHNIGFAKDCAADIDFDMFLYWLTVFMKGGPRALIGVPEKEIHITQEDWQTFPCLNMDKSRATPYHFPTNPNPGACQVPDYLPGQSAVLNKTLPKSYADREQFIKLGGEPEAHAQKFVAGMRFLLTYQPEVLRKRLEERFGDMPLDFHSLGPKLKAQYEAEFPAKSKLSESSSSSSSSASSESEVQEPQFYVIFNDTTNKMLFVDFMMQIYQAVYDHAYRVIVLYSGCTNNGYGVKLEPTWKSLYMKPSIFKDIKAWVQDQNEKLELYPQLQFSEEELLNRYQQIWRDAFAPDINVLLGSCRSLVKQLFTGASYKNFEEERAVGKTVTDESVTDVMDYIGPLPLFNWDEISSMVVLHKDSQWTQALMMAIEFTNALSQIVKEYYSVKRDKLTVKHNSNFSTGLLLLEANYFHKIVISLANLTDVAISFERIFKRLKDLREEVAFELHLSRSDESIKAIQGEPIQASLTDKSTLGIFTEQLFAWAETVGPEEFRKYIDAALKEYKKPGYLPYNRNREANILEFLETSERLQEKSDYKLAYILTSAETETGAFNKIFIKHLAHAMLGCYPNPTIATALREGTFEEKIDLFISSAVSFALSNRWDHLANETGKDLFSRAFYEWVQKLNPERFSRLKNEANAKYKASTFNPNLSWFFRGENRSAELINACAQNPNNYAKAIAIVINKGKETSTLNQVLFEQIYKGMQNDLNFADISSYPGLRLAQYVKEHNKEMLLKEVIKHAEEYSNLLLANRVPYLGSKASSSSSASNVI